MDEKFEYSQKRDRQLSVVVVWNPKEEKKSEILWHLFDLDNRPLRASTATKISLNRGNKLSSTWRLDLMGITPATYRLDVLLAGQTVWRTLFSVVP